MFFFKSDILNSSLNYESGPLTSRGLGIHDSKWIFEVREVETCAKKLTESSGDYALSECAIQKDR